MPKTKQILNNDSQEKADDIFKAACGCYSYIGFERVDFDKFLSENPTFLEKESSSFILNAFQDFLLSSGNYEVMQ